MQRLPAAVSCGVVVLLLGTGVARADPQFVLTDVEARAGDSVRFTISGTEERASYVLELRDKEVAHGSVPAEGSVAAAFTMPDLGATPRTVVVEAKITQPDETTEVPRSLRYVLPAPAPPSSPAAVVTAPAPAVPAAAVAPQGFEPQHGLKPGPARRKTETPRKRNPRPAGRKRAVSRHPASTRARKRRPGTRAKRFRTRRNPPRTAPLFDGVPEGPPQTRLARGGGPLVLNAIAPPTALLGTDPAAGEDGGGPAAILLVPLFAGLIALLLAATALLRSRRAGPATDSPLATLDRVARSGEGLRRGLARRMRRR